MSKITQSKKTGFNIKFYLNTRRELVYAILLMAVSTLMIFLVVVPSIKKTSNQRHNLESRNRSLAKLRVQVAEADNLNLTANVNKLAVINDVLPDKKPLLEVMAQISNLSKITGVTVDRMELSPGEIHDKTSGEKDKTVANKSKKKLNTKKSTASNQGSMKIGLSVSGTFKQINNFMNLLEKMAPLTTINSFSLSYSGSGQELENNQVSMKLEITTYFYRPSNDPPKEDLKLTAEDLKLLDTLTEFQLLTTPIDIDTSTRIEDLFDVVGWKGMSKDEVMNYLRNQP